MPWVKGKSGNAGGRPKKDRDMERLCQEHGMTALDALVEIVTNVNYAPASRVSAATELLNRGYGKPTQKVAGADGGPIELLIGWQGESA